MKSLPRHSRRAQPVPVANTLAQAKDQAERAADRLRQLHARLDREYPDLRLTFEEKQAIVRAMFARSPRLIRVKVRPLITALRKAAPP